jgi:starch-binding outer membrane protein, SusD/RagB family
MKFIAKNIAKKWAMTGGVPLVLVLSLTMCSEDVLDKQPLGTLTDETFYKTEKDFAAATLAPYSTMLNLTYEQFGAGLWNGFLKPDDDVQHRDPNDAMDVFNWTPANNNFGWVWANAYKGIARANTVLDQLPKADQMDATKKPRYEAEAKFMRAWWYFLLATNWGDVPILTTVPGSVEETMVGNSKPGEVWDLIESDLKFASTNLPANFGSEKGRANKWTAQALLGKVQVYRAQWFKTPAKYADAITNLQAVVNGGAYKLTANYGDNFDEKKENNEESLFEVQDTEGDNINSWGTTDTGGRAGHAWTIYVSPSCYYGPVTGCAPKSWGEGYGQIDITPSLQAEFEAGDPRRYYTMYSEGEKYGDDIFSAGWSRTGHTPAKYNRPWDPNRFPNNWSQNNLRLIRYADVLLLLAEAKLLGNNDVAGAAALVNQVRARARTSPVPAESKITPNLPDVPAAGTPTAWFKQYLMHERRVELATEWDYRYEDLVRWHRAGLINIKTDVQFGFPESNTNWKDTYLLKPVPQSELDLNTSLKQNPGY